ncbi:hypothetical protein Ancab_005546, partial [Ancistrocladus abbreviatus]
MSAYGDRLEAVKEGLMGLEGQLLGAFKTLNVFLQRDHTKFNEAKVAWLDTFEGEVDIMKVNYAICKINVAGGAIGSK